jgi:hypothetical protein
MREVLHDMTKHVTSLFENVIITGTDEKTTIDAQDKDKMFYLIGEFKSAVPDFEGEFGLGSLNLLNGLLNFASYKTDESKFIVHIKDGKPEFEFRDRDGAKTKFKTLDSRFVGDGGKKTSIGKIPWEGEVVMTKAKTQEISQLAGMLSEVDDKFGLVVIDTKLFLTIGGKSETTHATTILLQEDVDNKTLNSNKFYYNTAKFLTIIKNAGTSPCTMSYCSRGVMGVRVETEHAIYNYYLRGYN